MTATADMEFNIGQQIGEYEVIRRLGAGGLGVVYEVRHLISQRAEAMKILLPDQLDTPEMAERFRREVQLLATLNHPNIAALHNAFYYEKQLVMVMELIHGETLRHRALRTAVPLPKALHFASQILSALALAHTSGIVHRDIKPSNIMVTDDDLIKLLDFGIAINSRSSDLTNPGFLLGSLNYMSPEQVMGGKATTRSDIYSVGVTLYELVTGRLPITGASNYEILSGHLQQIPPAPAQLNVSLPTSVSDAILRALAKDPNQRFATAQEFMQALELRPVSGDSDRFAVPTMASVNRTPVQSLLGQQPQGSYQGPPQGPYQGYPTPPPGSYQGQPPPQQPLQPVNQHTPTPFPGIPAPSQSSGTIQPLPIEELTKQLAVHIGPVAKFVVKKLTAQCSDLDQLYAEAAKQIPSEADRRAFLRSRRR
jgi:serine/threonine protein kinase